MSTLVILMLFVVTLRPDVGGTEDSPKFQFVGQVLGTAHSPGYPFYVMATYAFTRVPIGTLAYRVNLFSAVCGALACLCVFLTARRLGVTRPLSLAAALGAATSYPVWSNSVTAEVYTLAAVTSAAAIYFLIAFVQTGPGPAFAREASFGEVSPEWPAGRGGGRLYIACACWACGFGNHVTIAGILPAAVVYGLIKERSVLQPRIAITAAVIGLLGVAQYWFIAIRTLQGAPYLEARATTIQGVFDVIIARDVSWARFYQAQSTVAAIEVPMLLSGLGIYMGTAAIVLVVVAIAVGVWRRNAEVMVIVGAAGGTLAFIANLWGDVVGFITPVCVQLWPLAALGLQILVTAGQPTSAQATAGTQANEPTGRQANRASRAMALNAAGVIALLVPVSQFMSNRASIEALRQPGEGPGVRALYSQLPMRSAIVADNYWLARLVNYMHFSGEVSPDPNPRVLDNDPNDVKTAVADGLQVFAFEGAALWLNAQGLRFEHTTIARQPFGPWLADQPKGTLFVAAAAGRALPFDWLPASGRGRPATYSVLTWTIGEGDPVVEQNDTGVTVTRAIGLDDRALAITSNDAGPRLLWGDDVLSAIDRGLTVAAFEPSGQLLDRWAFAIDEPPGVELPPTPFVLRGEVACETLRPGQPADVTAVLAEGGWLATLEGSGKTAIAIETGASPSQWRHRLSHGRGEASVDVAGARLLFDAEPRTRPVFNFTIPTGQPTSAKATAGKQANTPTGQQDPLRVLATVSPGDVSAVRVCPASVPPLPATGGLDVSAEHDGWFGGGWHLAERAGTQRFRWSQQTSALMWRMDRVEDIRLLLRLRAANATGASIQASIGGTPLSGCKLSADQWTDCRLDVPATAMRVGINQLTLTSDTVSPTADRPGDPRELAFVMQSSRVRVGQ